MNSSVTRIEWLEQACSKSEERLALQNPHGCAGGDGFRMHIDNTGEPCRCGDEEIHTSFDTVIQSVKEHPLVFAINRQFLLDALNGLEGKYVLVFVKDRTLPIVLQDQEGGQTAIIMPAHENEIKTPQYLPWVSLVKK